MDSDRGAERWQIPNLALAAGLAAGGVLMVMLAAPFLPAIVWAATLAVLFSRFESAIRRRVVSPNLSALLAVAITAGIVVIPTIAVTGTLLNEAIRSAAVIGPILDPDSWARAVGDHPRLAVALQWVSERINLPDFVHVLTSTLAAWSGSIVRTSFSSVINLLLTFYFLFYFFRDRSLIVEAVGTLLPVSAAEYGQIRKRAADTVIATAFGTAAVAALQGGLGGLMFWWLGLSAPVFWGVLMALLAIVPFLGAFIVWAPAAGLLALGGHYLSAIILTAWGTIIVGFVDNLVYPILVANRLMMHTVLSFIAVVGGLILFGTPGIVLGPLVVALVLTLLDIRRQRLSISRQQEALV